MGLFGSFSAESLIRVKIVCRIPWLDDGFALLSEAVCLEVDEPLSLDRGFMAALTAEL